LHETAGEKALVRVFIIGVSGFIGQYLRRRLQEVPGCVVTGTFFSATPQDRSDAWHRVELTDRERLEQVFWLTKPDVVVHLAAIADVGEAEANPERATAVNVGGTASIARLCTQHRAKLIFVSTEYVFSGERGYYREDDTPRPHTHYGRTKWEAEQEISRLSSPWSILRTSIVYGWPTAGHRNFVPGLIDRLQNGYPYNGRTDVYRTPIYVEHLTAGIVKLVGGDYPGIHHVASQEWVSMYQFASAVARAFHLDSRLVVPAGEPSGTSSGTNVHRRIEADSNPDKLGLDCTRTMQLLGLRQPSLAEGLREMRARHQITD
jgi:dTDP-4-dehydrorhamnose reductase